MAPPFLYALAVQVWQGRTSTSLRKLVCATPPCSSSPRKRLSGNPADRQFVVPAQAGTQGQATEIPGPPLARGRRLENAANLITASQAGTQGGRSGHEREASLRLHPRQQA